MAKRRRAPTREIPRDGANPRERPGSCRPTAWIRRRSRFQDGANGENPSRREPQRAVRKPLPMRSHFIW